MFSSGIPKYKYVYPTLLFFIMFLLMLLARSLSAGEEATTHSPGHDHGQDQPGDAIQADWLYPDWTYADSPHGEMDFIRAADAFNQAAGFEVRLQRKETARNGDRLSSLAHRRLDSMLPMGGYLPPALSSGLSMNAF